MVIRDKRLRGGIVTNYHELIINIYCVIRVIRVIRVL